MSLYLLCCSVNGSVCLVCCVFVNCLMTQFAMCLGVVALLLLNVMKVFSVGGGGGGGGGGDGGGGALLDRPCMVFHTMCSVFLYVGSYLLIEEFESWITGVCSHLVFL